MLTKTLLWTASVQRRGILARRDQRHAVRGDKVGVGIVNGQLETALLT